MKQLGWSGVCNWIQQYSRSETLCEGVLPWVSLSPSACASGVVLCCLVWHCLLAIHKVIIITIIAHQIQSSSLLFAAKQNPIEQWFVGGCSLAPTLTWSLHISSVVYCVVCAQCVFWLNYIIAVIMWLCYYRGDSWRVVNLGLDYLELCVSLSLSQPAEIGRWSVTKVYAKQLDGA